MNIEEKLGQFVQLSVNQYWFIT